MTQWPQTKPEVGHSCATYALATLTKKMEEWQISGFWENAGQLCSKNTSHGKKG